MAKSGISERDYEIMDAREALEDLNDINNYFFIKKKVDEGNFDDIKLYLDSRIKKKKEKMQRTLELLEKDRNMSPETRLDARDITTTSIKMADEYLRKKKN
ncbi:hypothetical protein HYX16_03130 [Candidatus Woesearchaeota archaeon]|nr:hypothetical protein [Candidatus Woesearchaeota archaeon]